MMCEFAVRATIEDIDTPIAEFRHMTRAESALTRQDSRARTPMPENIAEILRRSGASHRAL